MNKRQLLSYLFVFVLLCGMIFAADSQNALAQNETLTVEAIRLENQLTMEDLQTLNHGAAEVFSHDGRVTFVAGTCTDVPVKDLDSAAKVALSMVELLGGDVRTRFIPWRELTDANGNHYFVFKQLYAGTTVLGGAVKVITDPEGNMIGFSSSVETELPQTEESEGITAEEAEQIVLDHAKENNLPLPALFVELTDKMILPMNLSVDEELDENLEGTSRFVWVVYSDNPASSVNPRAELPYLAHYVTMDGQYLYSLETIMPGDAAASAGFDAEYVFEFMEPVDYTGYVDMSDGTEKEISVTVMRDKRTGMYYLGNIERKIVVAKCYDFLYKNGQVVLESSPDNLEWDQVGLLALYNYCRAYDYYKAIGWTGGTGLATPILILNDYQDINHVQVDNAAFVGNYFGWSIFLTSYANDYSQTLDVIAHEFTHCVTDAVMTYNSYMNDYGAINEGMSDIQGKIAEMMFEGQENVSWVLGDMSLVPVRSMSEPRRYQQPAFSWDLYYIPRVQTPTMVNDWGGVHTNSSLLNQVAYRLIADGGMSLEEARAYWFAVDCSIVPGTDYPQLRELLPWVLKAQGMDRYQSALERALDATRMGNDALPEFFDSDRALVTLELPDNENFTDGNWMLNYTSVDVQGFIDKVVSLFTMVSNGDYSELPAVLQNMLNEPTPTPVPVWAGLYEEGDDFFGELMQLLFGGDAWLTEPAPTPEPTPDNSELSSKDMQELQFWMQDELEDVVYSTKSFAGQDGHTIRMMSLPGRTIPLLLYLSVNSKTEAIEHFIPVVYLNDRWYDLPDMAAMLSDAEEGETGLEDDERITRLVDDLVTKVVDNLGKIKSLDDALDLVTFTVKGGEINVIPAVGLENIVIPEVPENITALSQSPEDNIPPRKSRPKLTEE